MLLNRLHVYSAVDCLGGVGVGVATPRYKHQAIQPVKHNGQMLDKQNTFQADYACLSVLMLLGLSDKPSL